MAKGGILLVAEIGILYLTIYKISPKLYLHILWFVFFHYKSGNAPKGNHFDYLSFPNLRLWFCSAFCDWLFHNLVRIPVLLLNFSVTNK